MIHRWPAVRPLHPGIPAGGVRPSLRASRSWRRKNQVELVIDVGTKFTGPQPALAVPGQPLDVPVSQAVDGIAERVPWRRTAVRGEPEDLAAQDDRILGLFPALGVAGANIEEAVRAEPDPPAIVRRCFRYAGKDGLRWTGGECAVGVPFGASAGPPGCPPAPSRTRTCSGQRQNAVTAPGPAGRLRRRAPLPGPCPRWWPVRRGPPSTTPFHARR